MSIFVGAFIVITILLLGTVAVVHHVLGQENITPTQQVTTSPQPNLQYLPQTAYIVPVGPNGEVAAVPYQESGGASTAQATGIVGILTAVGTGLWAKMAAKKDTKQTNSALLDTQE